jgi:hypothetical protein
LVVKNELCCTVVMHDTGDVLVCLGTGSVSCVPVACMLADETCKVKINKDILNITNLSH